MSTKNLAQRMLAVAADVSHVSKDVTVKHAGANYKGLSHDGVVDAVRAALIKHGVLALPSVVNTRYSEAVTKSGNAQQMIDVDVETTFINADNMDERLSVVTTGTGIDSQDKAPGKAMSYAKKYGLIYAFLLITGENDEARPHESESYSRREQPTAPRPVKKDGPTERQKQFAWTLIQKLPEEQRGIYIDAMKVATAQGASEIIDELKLKEAEAAA